MPLVKLGYLLVRTIAKPIASAIKRQARNHPTFRRTCIAVAQNYHRIEVRLRRGLDVKKRLLPTSGRTHLHLHASEESATVQQEYLIKPLDEVKAIEVGSEFIGEAIVFFVAGTLLVLDQLSNRRKESERRADIEKRFTELQESVEAIRKQIKMTK